MLDSLVCCQADDAHVRSGKRVGPPTLTLNHIIRLSVCCDWRKLTDRDNERTKLHELLGTRSEVICKKSEEKVQASQQPEADEHLHGGSDRCAAARDYFEVLELLELQREPITRSAAATTNSVFESAVLALE